MGFIIFLFMIINNFVCASVDDDLQSIIPQAFYAENPENTAESKKLFLAILKALHSLKVSKIFLDQENDWEIGQDIIDTLNRLLNEQKAKLEINLSRQSNAPTYVDVPKDRKNYVRINLNLLKIFDTVVGCLTPYQQAVKRGEKIFDAYPIWYDRNPPEVTLGHELIHVIHILEDHATYKQNLVQFNVSIWPCLMSTQMRPARGQNIWQNLEEQITTLGRNDRGKKSGVSEFWLRIASGRLPRYAYHDSPTDKTFFESADIIQTIMTTLLGEQWQDLLRQLSQDVHVENLSIDQESIYSVWPVSMGFDTLNQDIFTVGKNSLPQFPRSLRPKPHVATRGQKENLLDNWLQSQVDQTIHVTRDQKGILIK